MGGWASCLGMREEDLWYKNAEPKQKRRIPKREKKRQTESIVEELNAEAEAEEMTLKPSRSELDLDRPNIEDYLPSGSLIQHEPHEKLRL